jgi:hypothetical protein
VTVNIDRKAIRDVGQGSEFVVGTEDGDESAFSKLRFYLTQGSA